ncbi:hypothetical protein PISMIDRAFT_651270 [Pisolithus microcarpus 441]|uniref:UBC core domain-containing protein n=1 Tax=Pisolithus microcarpus 441 TaxID=765257 RepID=A0A0C9YMU9_9AGAM|nr:ubiquitin-conjugating enzyme/RWD-like protein [Pisolithus microcarpus]KIK11567.1 hypothetical protein PISMIDRAFT_651270 [Pisolithus microcarpus 441]
MELSKINIEGCPAGIKLLSTDNFDTWLFSIEVLGESLYQVYIFKLMFRFNTNYPISAPAVQFVIDHTAEAPIHLICTSILGTEWSPVLSMSAVCIMLQSMLTSCKVKEQPVDIDKYIWTMPDNLRKVHVLLFQ